MKRKEFRERCYYCGSTNFHLVTVFEDRGMSSEEKITFIQCGYCKERGTGLRELLE